MRETLKVLSVVILLFSAPAAVIVWTDDQPSAAVSALKIACPVLSVLAIATFLKLHFRADQAPDYLRSKVGSYFNRGGFCFAFRTAAIEGVCNLDVFFQNQHDRPCIGRIALRPTRGFFLGRAAMETIGIEIRCEPAAYGVAKVAIAVPAQLQGRNQSFDVGASVERPSGKGQTLRFHDGIVIRANSNFGNAFGSALTIASALTGRIVLSRPVTVAIELPTDVAEEVPDGLKPEVTTLWKLGDAAL